MPEKILSAGGKYQGVSRLKRSDFCRISAIFCRISAAFLPDYCRISAVILSVTLLLQQLKCSVMLWGYQKPIARPMISFMISLVPP